MSLREEIRLTKKQFRVFGVFPDFFENALNNFHYLTKEHGFNKPDLATWKNEGQVSYTSGDLKVIIGYESPDWVDVTFKKPGRPGRISLRNLLRTLGISIHQGDVGSDQNATMEETIDEIAQTIQSLSSVLQENSAEIFTYLKNKSK